MIVYTGSNILLEQLIRVIEQNYMRKLSERKNTLKVFTERSHSQSIASQNLVLPSLLKSQSKKQEKVQNFDKYYIRPNLRYKTKNENPKSNPQNYADETFVYKNMHNNNFWNWVHPLDIYQSRKDRTSLIDKVSLPILQRFRNDIQNKSLGRVPLVVEELLKGSI